MMNPLFIYCYIYVLFSRIVKKIKIKIQLQAILFNEVLNLLFNQISLIVYVYFKSVKLVLETKILTKMRAEFLNIG